MTTQGALLSALAEHTATGIPRSSIRAARRHFSRFGYAKVPFLAPPAVKEAVAREVDRLIDSAAVRRDLRFAETGYTPRRMRNVSRTQIAERSDLIEQVYRAEPVLRALSQIAGEAVHECPYEPEQFVITCLEQNGDTHGWHWDDYAFALVWVIECPPVGDGGFVQCVPGTVWNKQNPEINRALTQAPIYSVELAPGDLYLMRTNTTLHRVYPLQRGIRKIINMGYASTSDLTASFSHETMDNLWAEPSAVGGVR